MSSIFQINLAIGRRQHKHKHNPHRRMRMHSHHRLNASHSRQLIESGPVQDWLL